MKRYTLTKNGKTITVIRTASGEYFYAVDDNNKKGAIK